MHLQFACFSNILLVSRVILQVDKRSSKPVFTVIAVMIVLLLSVAAGFVFVKKYVCGGRLVYVCCVEHVQDRKVRHDICIVVISCALQVLSSQVLCAAAACRRERCRWDGRAARDQPHSKWQDRVPRGLGRGDVFALVLQWNQWHI